MDNTMRIVSASTLLNSRVHKDVRFLILILKTILSIKIVEIPQNPPFHLQE